MGKRPTQSAGWETELVSVLFGVCVLGSLVAFGGFVVGYRQGWILLYGLTSLSLPWM